LKKEKVSDVKSEYHIHTSDEDRQLIPMRGYEGRNYAAF